MAIENEKHTLNFFVMGMRELLGSFTDSKDPNWGRIIISAFLLCIAFLFIGVEALKVIFRRNFIKNEVNIIVIILAAFAFWGWAWLCFSQQESENYRDIKDNLTVAGWLYIFIGLIVLARGAYEWNKSNKSNSGTILGESILLGFLKNSWWDEYRLKLFAEPLAVFAIALPLVAVNYYLGIPLLFCGVSQIIFNFIFAIKRIEYLSGNLDSESNNVNNKNVVQ